MKVFVCDLQVASVLVEFVVVLFVNRILSDTRLPVAMSVLPPHKRIAFPIIEAFPLAVLYRVHDSVFGAVVESDGGSSTVCPSGSSAVSLELLVLVFWGAWVPAASTISPATFSSVSSNNAISVLHPVALLVVFTSLAVCVVSAICRAPRIDAFAVFPVA